MEVLAAEQQIGGQITGNGPLADFLLNAGSIGALFTKGISVIIGVLTVSAGLWFIFQFFLGALGWLSAGGDKTAIENARKKITNAVIGLVIVIAAIFLIDLIGTILGLNILSPGEFIQDVWK